MGIAKVDECRGEVSADTVPRVVLGSTHIRALEGGVRMDQLEEFKFEEKK